MDPSPRPGPLRPRDARRNTHGIVHVVYSISAGTPSDPTAIDQTEPPRFEAELHCSPDGAWYYRSPDDRLECFGVSEGERIAFDAFATPARGELVAAVHPGCDGPDICVYDEAIGCVATIVGVARSIVSIRPVKRFAA